MIKLYNTLTRKKENFKPLKKRVGFYSCGPTVYNYAHIGNMRYFLFVDIMKRVLVYNDLKVKHVMNITDVGHLTSDADTGEDKLEKGAKREKKTVWQVAEFYTRAFKKDLKNLNIIEPDVWIKATETIKEQIDLIKKLEKKGFTYQIDDGIYFDTSKLKNYGQLWGQKAETLKAGARVKMAKGKKHSTDFALWKLTPKGVKRQMEWDSPWGRGFPGWHTECVVMGIKELGIPFDIHAGGIDHIPIHHPNEIAQAEGAYSKNHAKFWMHGDFLITKEKMSKSKGNIIILDNFAQKDINPLAYRYLTLTAHYRSKLSFSWKNLQAAQNALNNLYTKTTELAEAPSKQDTNDIPVLMRYQKQFLKYINDDLDMPKAVALMWQMLDNSKLTKKAKHSLLINFDKIFGLDLVKVKKQKIPKQVLELAKKREKFRESKEWQKADKLRQQIEKLGFEIEDSSEGSKIKKI